MAYEVYAQVKAIKVVANNLLKFWYSISAQEKSLVELRRYFEEKEIYYEETELDEILKAIAEQTQAIIYKNKVIVKIINTAKLQQIFIGEIEIKL